MMNKEQEGSRIVARDDTVTLLQEDAVVDVRAAATGRVRVETHTERIKEIAHAELKHDAVTVSRIAINRPVVGEAPQTRTEGDVTIIPVLEEILVVETRLMLKEELHIRKQSTMVPVDVPVELRRQSATIERSEAD